MLLCLGVTTFVGLVKDCSSTEEVIVREMIPSQIIQIRHTLSCRVKRQRRRLRVNAKEHLLRVAKLAGLEEEFQGGVGGEVDADALIVGAGPGGAWDAGAALQALDKGVAEDVGGVFEEGDFAPSSAGGVVDSKEGGGGLASED